MEGTAGEFLYAGIKRAKYDLVACLDDDDEFVFGKIDRDLSFFEKDDKLVCYCNSSEYIIDKNDIVNYRLIDSDGTRRMFSIILPWS